MTDLLLIVGPADADATLLEKVVQRKPDRVTVLMREAGNGWALDDSDTGHAVRDRLASLLSAVERQTGATVVGLAGGEQQLIGWRFDRVVEAAPLIAA
jgi:hypothetical protein